MLKCGLNDAFIMDLKEGKLKGLLDFVRKDDTLSLEIRHNFIELYYRGQKLFEIRTTDGKYQMISTFGNSQDTCEVLGSAYEEWIREIPSMKQRIDFHLHENPNLNMEYGQLLMRENNTEVQSKNTDYYIAAMDYSSDEKNKISFIGIKWLATESSRTKGDRISIAFIEMKYGDKKQVEDSILQKHVESLNRFVQNKKNIFAIYEDIETIFNQKVYLGLINGVDKEISINRNIKPELILIVSSHRVENTQLISEIRKITTSFDYSNLVQNMNMKVAKTTNAGYALYEEQILSVQEFVNEYQDMWGTHIDY